VIGRRPLLALAGMPPAAARIALVLVSVPSVLAVAPGQLKVLALASRQRFPVLPTLVEAGCRTSRQAS
jgi:tripartite-type tricarboxylate transporter receptor subunit TctC